MNTEKALKFISTMNELKHMPRMGWVACNIANPETISGHMYSMAMMTFLLGPNSTLDRLRCMQLALVHDLAESIVGDITPRDNIPEDEKHCRELEAMQTMTGLLDPEVGSLILDLYREYEAKQTAEARFVKDLDRFDMIMTARGYEARDGQPDKLQEFFDSTKDKFEHPLVQKLVDELHKQRNKDLPTV